MMKPIYLVLGFTSLLLGLLGIFLPLLPTTPFALLSLYCFDRSSPRLRQWVLTIPWIGPLVLEWQRTKSIPLRAKIISFLLIFICALWSFLRLWGTDSAWALWIAYPVMLLVLLFIWTRPH